MNLRPLALAAFLLTAPAAAADVTQVFLSQATSGTSTVVDTGRAAYVNIQLICSSVVGTVDVQTSLDGTTYDTYLTLTDPASQTKTIPSRPYTKLVFTRTSGTITAAYIDAVRLPFGNTTMIGATALTPGIGGLVPPAAAGDQAKALLGDGTWGTISGGLTSPVGVTDGGTGGTSASAARTNLGLVIGTDVAAAAHGVTTGYVPYGSSSTALAASQIQRVDSNTIRITNTNSTGILEICGYYVDASNYACTRIGNNGSNLMHVTNRYAGTGSTMGAGGMAIGPETGGDNRIFGSGSLRFRVTSAGFLPEGNGLYDIGNTSGNYPRIVMTTHGLQGGDSVALVDATATNFLQVPVASNGYEGFTLHYTIRATDGTNQQIRQGSVKVSVMNQGGTETCAFGTADEVINASTGTLTVAFDCTAGTNTVMLRANADTSLASTTSFTIESFPILTSGVAVTTPQ